MRKGSSIIGLKILTRDEATDLGKVQDLIFDHNSDEVLALVVSGADLFGLIDAKVIPWNQITSIGPDTVMVQSRDAEMKAHSDERVGRIMDREHKMSGTRVYTEDGRDLGSFADMYIDEVSGRVLGYELSGGFFSDTLSGKRFMVPPSEITVGKDAMIVPSDVAADLEAQRQNQPGGLKATVGGAVDSTKETLGGALDSTKTALGGVVDTAKDKYADIASASVEKQKEFVVGKTAGKDVTLPADASVSTPETRFVDARETLPSSGAAEIERVETPTANFDAPQGVLVHQGETITQEHADRAERAGILGQLLLAAGAHTASGAMGSASESAQGTGGSVKDSAAQAAIGKTAGKDVTENSGSLIAADGMTITQEMMDHAQRVGKEKELIAAAGLGAAKDAAETVKTQAVNLWDSIKGKAAELSDSAHEKKAEMDAAAQQKKINDALGRPVTRVILNQSDTVLLNTGDLITHAAIRDAEQAGVLDVLLDSVYEGDPEITPEMLRATEPGEDALDTQAQPSGGPITATVPQNDNARSAQDTNPNQ